MSAGLFTPRDAAAILGVEEARLARWVRSGIVVPSEKRGRRRLFTFPDLIAAKAAKLAGFSTWLRHAAGPARSRYLLLMANAASSGGRFS